MIPVKDDNPTELTPFVTVGLMVASIAVFMWELTWGDDQRQMIFALGAIPAVLFDIRELPPGITVVPAELTVLTSMFLHGDLLHLGGNMLFLWIFGNNIEDAMGHVRFIVFYFLCGTGAVFAQAVTNPDSIVPMIGASGAISGVLGAYLLLYPRARVLVVIPIGFYLHTVALSAGVVLGFWFFFQFVSSFLNSGEEGGVAWMAHLGGFLLGVVLVPFFRRRGIRLFQGPRY